jgi:predicted metal-dependent hydrolase
MTLAQSPTEIPPRCALPPFFKGGQGRISSRSVMKCANLLWSDLVNGTSILLPYMEPFIIDAIREASKLMTDPELQKEAKVWIGQESQHFMQHRRFNEVLIAQGYPQLRAREKEIEQEYEALRKRPLKFQVAYTAGFETLALALGHTIIADRAHLLRGADPAVASLWLWHVVEEIEHKNLAFDVYQHVYGDYWYRVYGMLYAMMHLTQLVRGSYMVLLKADGLWGKKKTHWAIKKLTFRLFASALPGILRHALPWHHPSRVADPAWMREWVALYDEGEKGLAKLDTSRLPLSPKAMLPA